MNDVSLREYLETRFAELDRRIEQRLDLEQRALTVATTELSRRLEGLNELRHGVVERKELDAKLEVIYSRIVSMEKRLANYDGRMLVSAGVVAIIISAAMKWLIP